MLAKPYASLRPELKTGDLILFDGKSEVSELIKYFSGPRSHIGMVLRPNGEDVFLFESTTLSDVRDVESGEYTKGVQYVFLSDRIATYDGDFYVRQLARNLEQWQRDKLHTFRKRVRGLPYEKNKLNLVASLFRGFGTDENLSSFFCSELVAEAYQQAGLLPDVDRGGMPSDAYRPSDFSDQSKNPIGLLGDIHLLPEVKIV